LKYTYRLEDEAKCIEDPVAKTVLAHRTYDIVEEGKARIGTREMGDLIAQAVASA